MHNYRKKLIEVALPLAKINEAAAKEKSIRHGHPSTLHLWWARRPLAACRAVLFASLVDDPDSDPAYRRPDGSVDEERAAGKRAELFDLIEEMVLWENSNNPRVINKARAEIARCVASRKIETGEMRKDEALTLGGVSARVTPWDFVIRKAAPEAVNAFLAEQAPPVLDPFCGGGSIPLEAQRLGLRAHASDLNPVPVLITKALIEIPPKFAGRPPVRPETAGKRRKGLTDWSGARGLAEDVRYYGEWMRDEAQKRIGHLYPKVRVTAKIAEERPDLREDLGKELTVIAWLWARTVECPNPSCRARAPLVRSFWLSTKQGKACFVAPVLDAAAKRVKFTVRFTGEPRKHTTDRNGATCLFCETFIKKGPLRDIATQQGIEEELLAVVAEGTNGRIYLPAEVTPIPAVAKPSVAFLEQAMPNDRRWFSPPLYGMPNYADLFTPRQLVALTTFVDLVQEVRECILADARASGLPADGRSLEDAGLGARAYADAVCTYLALVASKATVSSCAFARWRPGEGKSAPAFGRQAIPMVWDYAEVNPFAGAGGDFAGIVDGSVKTLLRLPASPPADVRQHDATSPFPLEYPVMAATDPPYYDNIGYADLSDFFYVWLRRTLLPAYPELLSTVLTPKAAELVASSSRQGDLDRAKCFFEEGLGRSFAQLRSVQPLDYPMTVYYAFKQAETEEDEDDTGDDVQATVSSTGWETMLEGLVRVGFTITGTWPSRTEGKTRLIAMGTNALASSVVIVCRPRSGDAPQATRKQFITALRHELPDALRNLQRGFVAPVDLAQASIGPGMAVFTRYSKVMESDGSPLTVRTALGLINQALDEILAEQEGEFDPSSRWAIAWFEQHGTDSGPFGEAEVLSKAKNTGLNRLVESGVVQSRAGKVRLTPRDEMPVDATGTIWQATQQLIRALDTKGESGAAALLRQFGETAEIARDLAYRLYNVCERKKWAEEARAYNGLVVAWPELVKLAQSQTGSSGMTQQEFA